MPAKMGQANEVPLPREGTPLVETMGSSFPSGHAAYATAWLAVALAASWRLGLASRATLAIAAVGLAVAIGVSRIYLRVHYFSDVAGGWGLGVGIFGLLAAVALRLRRMRTDQHSISTRLVSAFDDQLI